MSSSWQFPKISLRGIDVQFSNGCATDYSVDLPLRLQQCLLGMEEGGFIVVYGAPSGILWRVERDFHATGQEIELWDLISRTTILVHLVHYEGFESGGKFVWPCLTSGEVYHCMRQLFTITGYEDWKTGANWTGTKLTWLVCSKHLEVHDQTVHVSPLDHVISSLRITAVLDIGWRSFEMPYIMQYVHPPVLN